MKKIILLFFIFFNFLYSAQVEELPWPKGESFLTFLDKYSISQKLYFDLEKALWSAQYASLLKPYQRAKDGRAAYLSIIQQYAGLDKWENELKRCNVLLATRCGRAIVTLN